MRKYVRKSEVLARVSSLVFFAVFTLLWELYVRSSEDYRLDGFQILSLFSVGLKACFQRCLRNIKCELINFDNSENPPESKSKIGTCELNGSPVNFINYLTGRDISS